MIFEIAMAGPDDEEENDFYDDPTPSGGGGGGGGRRSRGEEDGFDDGEAFGNADIGYFDAESARFFQDGYGYE